jgi:hypothetical protein
MGARPQYAETGAMTMQTDTHTRGIAKPLPPSISPLARDSCKQCGIRIEFLHVALCDQCLTDRLEELDRSPV